jgi:hypothetical protein
MVSYEPVALDDFGREFLTSIGELTLRLCVRVSSEISRSAELSSVSLGGRVIDVSDDFFAEAFHLLLVEVSA